MRHLDILQRARAKVRHLQVFILFNDLNLQDKRQVGHRLVNTYYNITQRLTLTKRSRHPQ